MSGSKLQVYNTLSRNKELFTPIHPPFVGMYVCGPTVYGDAHLGHARPAITFDVVYRYLVYSGYKVRYVRNITDVGHLVNDADAGEDKVGKKAKMEKLEPMELVHHYVLCYHKNLEMLNVLSPSIEPYASGHIIEQIEMIKTIIEHGYAYVSNGSVYFDIERYKKDYPYGQLSGRSTDDLLSNTRELEGQSEKKGPLDFALWKKADPEHIMHWPSPWSEGFPGWHIECSAMSKKYLGETFDIHGGGMDLLFPHHECEIAQSMSSSGKQPVRYWMHNNMLTINGQKMGKSLGNFITLDELFAGKHKLLEQAYSPMTLRFCLLQGHYRNPIDFSNQALQDAEKAFTKISDAYVLLNNMEWKEDAVNASMEKDLAEFEQECRDAMNDDFNTAIVIANMFKATSIINQFNTAGKTAVNKTTFDNFKKAYIAFYRDVLGLRPENQENSGGQDFNSLVDTLIHARDNAKKEKDFKLSDALRNILMQYGELKDTPQGTTFKYEKKK
jgi:cysteinyl-tRNA synthetase